MERSAKETLRSYSIIYIILAIFSVALAVICSVIPEISNMLKTAFGNEGMLTIYVGTAVNVILYLWYFWLTRRVADGKSNGTLLMILLVLGVVGAIVSFFTAKASISSLLSLDFIVDIIGLCYLVKARQEK